MICSDCGYDDHSTGDTAHSCSAYQALNQRMVPSLMKGPSPSTAPIYDSRARTTACEGTGPKLYPLGSPSTVPTVEVAEDIRIARHAVFNLKEFRAGRSTFPGEALGILERCLDRLASKPPAREAAERQSIAYDPEFVIILKRVMAASERIDSYHGQRLIAYIDIWGGAAKGESDGR